MKRIIILMLALALMLTFTACGEKGSDSKSSDPSAVPTEGSNTPSGETQKKEVKEEIKVYGISEAAEANGLAITIDNVEGAGSDIMLNKAKDGFAYMKVYYTFKNVSNEAIETPSRKKLYIVYEEGPTGEKCDMTSDDSSEVMLEVKDRDERYMSRVDLAPGESTSGWLIYQRQADKDEVTMHYYSGFINVAPDLVFKFTAP